MEHFYHQDKFGEDWFSYPRLYSEVVSNLTDNSHIVEVGSWKGKSAAFMAVEIINSGKKIKFDCVDNWLGSPEHQGNQEVIDNTLYNIFISNIEPVRDYINIVRSDSVAASKLYEDKSLDFVFIDADHTYESVKADIESWLPKIKNGGTIAGHDYNSAWPGVDRAVNEKFNEVIFSEYCWIKKV